MCIRYLDSLKTFSDIDDNHLHKKLATYIKNLWTISELNNPKLVTAAGIIDSSTSDYYDWILDNCYKNITDTKYLILLNQIVIELKNKSSKPVLLHSDFHEQNIGLVDSNILLFDSGYCPFLYGHRFHDLSRLVLYYPGKLVFANKSIDQRIQPLFEEMKTIIES